MLAVQSMTHSQAPQPAAWRAAERKQISLVLKYVEYYDGDTEGLGVHLPCNIRSLHSDIHYFWLWMISTSRVCKDNLVTFQPQIESAMQVSHHGDAFPSTAWWLYVEQVIIQRLNIRTGRANMSNSSDERFNQTPFK